MKLKHKKHIYPHRYTSKYVGVSFRKENARLKQTKVWTALLPVTTNGTNDKSIMTYHETEEDAAKTRDKLLIKYRQSYKVTKLNFPERLKEYLKEIEEEEKEAKKYHGLRHKHKYIDKSTVEFIVESQKYGEFKVLIDAEDWERIPLNFPPWGIEITKEGQHNIRNNSNIYPATLAGFVMNELRTGIVIYRKDGSQTNLDYRKSNLYRAGIFYDFKNKDTYMTAKFFSRKHGEIETLFDIEDQTILMKGTYNSSPGDSPGSPVANTFYFKCKRDSKSTSLHRLIMNCPSDMVIDHINNNPLDNRKSNLRIVTQRENCHNRKYVWGKNKYRGVKRSSTIREQYYAVYHRNGNAECERFNTEEEAALAYDKEVIKTRDIVNPSVQLNFPERLEEYLAEIQKEGEKNEEERR